MGGSGSMVACSGIVGTWLLVFPGVLFDDGRFRGPVRRGEGGWLEGRQDGGRVPVNDRQQGARRSFRGTTPTFPMLNGIETESKDIGKTRLRHAEPVADRLDIDVLRNMDLEARLLSGKESLNIVKAVHHLFKLRFHPLPPVSVKNTVGPFFQRISFGLRQVLFLILRKNGDEKDWKFVVSPDINNPCPATLSHSLPRYSHLPEPASAGHHVPTFRIGSDQPDDVERSFSLNSFMAIAR
jgi:hypothetical protein